MNSNRSDASEMRMNNGKRRRSDTQRAKIDKHGRTVEETIEASEIDKGDTWRIERKRRPKIVSSEKIRRAVKTEKHATTGDPGRPRSGSHNKAAVAAASGSWNGGS